MFDQFSTTVEKIYAAATDAGRWGEALAAVEHLTGSAGAVIHLVSKQPGGELVTLLGDSAKGYFLAEHLAEWTRDYAPICPRLAAAVSRPDAPYYVDYMLMGEREMDLNPVYAWYGSYGLRYFIGSRLCHDNEVEIVWSLQRRAEQGHVQQPDVDLFELLKPHLAQSLSLARELDTLRVMRSISRGTFEALSQALFALDGRGQLIFANDAAAELTRAADGLAVVNRHLSASLATEHDRLLRLVAQASDPAVRLGGWTKVSRPSGKAPYAVLVAPLESGDEGLAAAGAKVLVIIKDPCSHQTVEPRMLTSLYGLTDTEARLASAIAGGHSLESAAALLNMQVATSRSHLKSIFSKVGVHRQQDLVRLLTSLSLMHM